MSHSDRLVVISFLAVAAWLTLLLVGWTLGGAVHLILLLALIIFPWRRLRDRRVDRTPGNE